MTKRAAVLVGLSTLALMVPMAAGAEPARPAPPMLGAPEVSTQSQRQKIDVMALWSHPDDDAGFTTPCGVWGDRFDVRCGIIMATRGEGGSNSVGNEAGPGLGLRRENEDRASHVRTGTIDIFNIDRVDFYYNTSAPLTKEAWDGDEALRRVVRIIRETRPSIMIGWPPNFDYGHGNHQYAGRLVWEAVEAAADPTRFPEQLNGVGAVEPWQVSKVIQQTGWGFPYEGSGGRQAPDCNVGYTPAPENPFTMAGTWSGYASPYTWVAGNTAGVPAGTPKTWAQVGREGGRAHPTQARVMQKEPWDASCLRFGVLQSVVPMQPNGTPDGDKDESLFFGATIPDPGGLPLGTTLRITPEDFAAAPGEPFTVDVSLAAPGQGVPAGRLSLKAPDGWDVSAPVKVRAGAEATARFTVTSSADAKPAMHRLSAHFEGGGKTAYNETQVETVPQVQGLFARTGNSAELDQWIDEHDVHVYGRSPAVDAMGVGESRTVSVEATNRSSEPQLGTVDLAVPEGFVVEPEQASFDAVAPGATSTVDFVVTHGDPSAAGSQVVEFTATTATSGSRSSETMAMRLVPTTVVPRLAKAPVVDGTADDVYEADDIAVGKHWEGDECEPDGKDCGTGSTATLGWYDDALYAHVTVVDDTASAAAPPDRCFGHWLVDSVEFLVDPRGTAPDTSSTFKLGMFSFSDDPTNSNGNGVNGPCWSRDADNHQGFSTGPLAQRVKDAPNAPGVEVAVDVERARDGSYVGGSYQVEVKVPLAALPAAVGPTSTPPTGHRATNDVDPDHMGLNLTPYDSDRTDFIGETRTGWSAFDSQQSEPGRWGHAYLEGYEPPAGRALEASPAIIPDTALTGVESPQTIHQSAARGITMSGVQPSEALTVTDAVADGDGIAVHYVAKRAGTLRGFVWKGDTRFVPVWTSSCKGDVDGFDACSDKDGAAPPWAPDMGGRLRASAETDVQQGAGTMRIPVAADALERLAPDGRLLLSWAEAGHNNGDGVTAWSYPIVAGDGPEPSPSPTAAPGDDVTPGLPRTGAALGRSGTGTTCAR